MRRLLIAESLAQFNAKADDLETVMGSCVMIEDYFWMFKGQVLLPLDVLPFFSNNVALMLSCISLMLK